MRAVTLLGSILLLTLPAAVQAQAGLELSAPTPTAVPPAPQAASNLSSEAQPRWPSTRPYGVDPELLALRAGPGPQQTAGRAPHIRPFEREQEDGGVSGPDFGASLGHAAAGFGIGAGTGGLLGGVVGALACAGDDFCSVFAGMYGAAFGAITMAPVGAALGTWGFGELAGGTGNGFAALGGAYLGAGAGVGLSVLFASQGEGGLAAVAAPAIGIALSMLGSAAGYQLTSHGGRARTRERAEPQAIVLPTLSPTEDGEGAMVGVAGAF